jgi:hypothetical protein
MKRYKQQLGSDYPMHPLLGILLLVTVWLGLIAYCFVAMLFIASKAVR